MTEAAGTYATDLVPVSFEFRQELSSNEAVYVLGDRPELGGNDMRRAVQLDSTMYPNWQAQIALPRGSTVTFRYVVRDELPGEIGDASNGEYVSSPQTVIVGGDPVLVDRTYRARLSMVEPVLHWEDAEGQSGTAAMQVVSDGRTENELTFAAGVEGTAPGAVNWWIEDARSGARVPSEGVFHTGMTDQLVQDGEVFTWDPGATAVSPPRLDADGERLRIYSVPLNRNRAFQVYLPRGYDSHPDRRYPVLYFQDGQMMFDGLNGKNWHVDDNATDAIARGEMEEAILVANWYVNRFADYVEPERGHHSDKYLEFLADELKPYIDANYRTETDSEHTGLVGSSLGANVSMYGAWTRPDTYGLVGALSGSWWTSVMPNWGRTQARSELHRVWMDSGDAGQSYDGMWGTVSMRNALIGRTVEPFDLSGTVHHTVVPNATHSEVHWAQRVDDVMSYLLPAAAVETSFDELDGGCAADIAPPFGEVSISDIQMFLLGFSQGDAVADLAADYGTFDLNDAYAFIESFVSGCAQ